MPGVRFRGGGPRGHAGTFPLLLSEPEKGNPSVVMQALTLGFARRMLATRRRDDGRQSHLRPEAKPAHVWQRRFYDYNVRSQHKRVEKPLSRLRVWGMPAGSGQRLDRVEDEGSYRLRRKSPTHSTALRAGYLAKNREIWGTLEF
jgi:hypothetical protein